MPRAGSAIVAAAVGFAFALVGTPMASAQAQQQQQTQPGAAPTEQMFSEQELESFAGAALEVKRISDQYTPRFQEAEDAAQQEEVRQEAEQKMVQAVQEEGLSIEKYNRISAAAQANPQLANRIAQHMQEQDAQ